jgi:hypothetical protein
MNVGQTQFLLVSTIAVLLAVSGCTNEKPQLQNVREVIVKEATATNGKAYTVWTITINPGTAAVGTCTADIPWQELYSNKDPSENDQVRFKSSSAQAYTITFPVSSPLATQDGHPAPPIQVPANNAAPNFAGPYVIAIQPHQLCPESNDTCAYPYNISFLGGAQCNSGNPPTNRSDGVVIKGGGS